MKIIYNKDDKKEGYYYLLAWDNPFFDKIPTRLVPFKDGVRLGYTLIITSVKDIYSVKEKLNITR